MSDWTNGMADALGDAATGVKKLAVREPSTGLWRYLQRCARRGRISRLIVVELLALAMHSRLTVVLPAFITITTCVLALLAVAACAAPRIAQGEPLAPAPSLRAAFDRMPSPGEARVRVLSNNIDAWVTRWRTIESAKKSLDVQYFIIHGDAFGLSFLGLLHEKRAQGLAVRLMVDSRGTATLTRAFSGLHLMNEVAGAGTEVRTYNNIETQVGAAAHGDFRKLVASNHDKLVIADGQTSILGGRNITEEYLSDPRDLPKAFIDMDVVIEGKATADALTRAFASELVTENAINVKAARSDEDADALALSTALMRTWLTDPPFTDAEIKALDVRETREALALEYEGKLVGALGHIPSDKVRTLVRTLTQQITTLPRLRGALDKARPTIEAERVPIRILDTRSSSAPAMRDRVTDNLLVAIAAAEHDVVLQSPYLLFSERGLQTLEAAAQRGVKVTILTNSPASSDSAITQSAFLEQWAELLVRVPTARLFVVGIERLMHAKVAVLDGKLSFVGSYNLGPISAHTNGEVVSAVWGERFANDLSSLVAARIARGKPEIFEYTIERGGGTERDAVVTFGPDDHCDKAVLAKVRAHDAARAVLVPFF